MQIQTAVNQLILAIYQGVMEEEPWSECLEQLNRVFATDLAVLVVVPRRQPSNRYLLNRMLNTSARGDSPAPTSPNHWVAVDPFQNIDDDIPVTLDELDQQQAVDQTPFFLERIQPSGIRYILSVNIPARDNHDLLLKLRIARRQQHGDFSEQDRELLTDLVPHFKQALQFLDQMAIKQIERNAFADAINQFMLGTLILDRGGRIVASNRVARDTIEQHTALTTQAGRLVIGDKQANQQLYDALAAISEQQAGSRDTPLPATITLSPCDTQALGLMIRPVRPEDALAHPVHAHAVVFISDPMGTPEISADTLKHLFGFTGSEARVAAYLANGHTLNEAAEALSISVNTAKSHARNIYEKTGVNKQTKFIQMISNSVARVS